MVPARETPGCTLRQVGQQPWGNTCLHGCTSSRLQHSLVEPSCGRCLGASANSDFLHLSKQSSPHHAQGCQRHNLPHAHMPRSQTLSSIQRSRGTARKRNGNAIGVADMGQVGDEKCQALEKRNSLRIRRNPKWRRWQSPMHVHNGRAGLVPGVTHTRAGAARKRTRVSNDPLLPKRSAVENRWPLVMQWTPWPLMMADLARCSQLTPRCCANLLLRLPFSRSRQARASDALREGVKVFVGGSASGNSNEEFPETMGNEAPYGPSGRFPSCDFHMCMPRAQHAPLGLY